MVTLPRRPVAPVLWALQGLRWVPLGTPAVLQGMPAPVPVKNTLGRKGLGSCAVLCSTIQLLTEYDKIVVMRLHQDVLGVMMGTVQNSTEQLRTEHISTVYYSTVPSISTVQSNTVQYIGRVRVSTLHSAEQNRLPPCTVMEVHLPSFTNVPMVCPWCAA